MKHPYSLCGLAMPSHNGRILYIGIEWASARWKMPPALSMSTVFKGIDSYGNWIEKRVRVDQIQKLKYFAPFLFFKSKLAFAYFCSCRASCLVVFSLLAASKINLQAHWPHNSLSGRFFSGPRWKNYSIQKSYAQKKPKRKNCKNGFMIKQILRSKE